MDWLTLYAMSIKNRYDTALGAPSVAPSSCLYAYRYKRGTKWTLNGKLCVFAEDIEEVWCRGGLEPHDYLTPPKRRVCQFRHSAKGCQSVSYRFAVLLPFGWMAELRSMP